MVCDEKSSATPLQLTINRWSPDLLYWNLLTNLRPKGQDTYGVLYVTEPIISRENLEERQS